MEENSELTITCRQCGKGFVFTASEQEFYRQKGFAPPYRCKECRSSRRSQIALICSGCGTRLGNNGSATYCSDCLGNVELEFELKARTLKDALDEVSAKLSSVESERTQLADTVNARVAAVELEKAQLVNETGARLSTIESEKLKLVQEAESEKAQLAALLQQEKHINGELQDQLNNTRTELEKALKYRATIEGLEPALNGVKERVEALERAQNDINQRMLQLLQMRKTSGMLGVLGRILRPQRQRGN